MSKVESNDLERLRVELLAVVEEELSPIALSWGYTETPLEEKIRWVPCVLVLGNYSSGKSSFINEYLGQEVQQTGQAPTDDSFTVLSFKKPEDDATESDGKTLIGRPQYPFSSLQKFGRRFAAHFRLKKIASKALEHLAIIDTPGMLDSVSEKDRGYDYQEVIAELAQIADLVLVFFDPHKAGTIRETYESLRKTLPKATYEDRVIFVLNRIDECSHLEDLLRVYGTLCWNLSQMTGRKDIPRIFLTWSEKMAKGVEDNPYLKLMSNHRSSLLAEIEKCPKHRLDHLITYIDEHSQRLTIYLRALKAYGRKRRRLLYRGALLLWLSSCALGIAVALLLHVFGTLPSDPLLSAGGGAILGTAICGFVFSSWKAWSTRRFEQYQLDHMNELVAIEKASDQDLWQQIEGPLHHFISHRRWETSTGNIKADLNRLHKVRKGLRDYRARAEGVSGSRSI